MISWSILGQFSDHWWEYFYSLSGRSIIWAAHEELHLTLGSLSAIGGGKTLSIHIQNFTPFGRAQVPASMVDEWDGKEGSVQRVVRLHHGDNATALRLPPPHAMGRHRVDVVLSVEGKHYDWGSPSSDLPKTGEITLISTDKHFYTYSDSIRVRFKTQSGNAV